MFIRNKTKENGHADGKSQCHVIHAPSDLIPLIGHVLLLDLLLFMCQLKDGDQGNAEGIGNLIVSRVWLEYRQCCLKNKHGEL